MDIGHSLQRLMNETIDVGEEYEISLNTNKTKYIVITKSKNVKV